MNKPISDTLDPFEGRNTGMHPKRQIYQVFYGRDLNNMQIDSLFYTMDTDRDEMVSDEEWTNFYTTFITSFETNCKAKNDMVAKADMVTCLKDDKTLN